MTVVFFTLYLYYILLFSIFQRTFWCHARFFGARRTAKLRHFFELTKYFKKNIYFFFSNFCSFNSQATSLDCGCKVTAFSETTKIFLCFFWKFFVTRYILRRKILILSHFLCFSCRFLCLFPSFFTPKKHAEEHNFSRFRIFLCFFNKKWITKETRFGVSFFEYLCFNMCLYCINNKKLTLNFANFANV